MTDNLIYRLGSINDLEELQKLAIVSYGILRKELDPDNWLKMETFLSSKANFTELINISISFVCIHRADIIGMAFLVPGGNPTAINPSDCCYIRMVGVSPLHSGKGIAKELTRQCIEYARQTGENTIMLHTSSEMMDAARHIYEKLGFEKFREIDPRYGKRYWLYKLELV